MRSLRMRVLLILAISIFAMNFGNFLPAKAADISFPGSTFIGTWLGVQYNCVGIEPPEQIDIQVTTTSMIATKITGDACVGAGKITWKTTLTNGQVSQHFNVDIQVGSGSQISYVPGTAQVISSSFIIVYYGFNTFYYFKTGSIPTSPFSINVSGTWVSEGYTCPDFVTFIPTEMMNIQMNGNDIIVTKAIGDDCVNSGELTWRGSLSSSQGSVIFPIQIQTGNPSGFRGIVNATAQIVRNDLIVVYNSGLPAMVFRKYAPTNFVYLPHVHR